MYRPLVPGQRVAEPGKASKDGGVLVCLEGLFELQFQFGCLRHELSQLAHGCLDRRSVGDRKRGGKLEMRFPKCSLDLLCAPRHEALASGSTQAGPDCDAGKPPPSSATRPSRSLPA
jgi:hypothetical protein